MCVYAPSTHFTAKYYCSSKRLHSLYILITRCSLTSLLLPLPYIHFLSIHCLPLSLHITLSFFSNSLLLLGSTRLGERGLNIRVNEVIPHFDTPRIISSFNFTARRRDFLPPLFIISSSQPATISSCHNVQQVGRHSG